MLDDTLLQDIKHRFGIIGNAEGLNRAIERAYMVAPTEYSVLITGESGTGKEFFPKIVHAYSARKHSAYIAINCGAIPNGTIDSELFGHVKGAFTGAVSDHKGYFEEANSGTIFLDEVGELPLETQVRLLRVLEYGEYMRVGSSQVQKTNVRVVAATNVNLEEAIMAGKFREDLFYRLSTISISVPSLRERKADIPVLFRKFAADCCERYRMPSIRLHDDARQLLSNYYWRGNIRQLKNIAEQLCVLEQKREISASVLSQYLPPEEQQRSLARYVPWSPNGSQADSYAAEREILYKMIFDMKRELDELRREVHQGKVQMPTEHLAVADRLPMPDQLQVSSEQMPREEYQQAEVLQDEPERTEPLTNVTAMQELEKEMIRQALERNNGNRKQTAVDTQIPERTLYRKIKEYGL